MAVSDFAGIALDCLHIRSVLGERARKTTHAAQNEKWPSEEWVDATEEHEVGSVSQERKQVMNQASKIN